MLMAWAPSPNKETRFDSEKLQKQAQLKSELEPYLKFRKQAIYGMKVTLKSSDETLEKILQPTPFFHCLQPTTDTSSAKAVKGSPKKGSATETTAQYQVAIHEPEEAPWLNYFKRKIGEYTQQRRNIQVELAIAEKSSFKTIREAILSIMESDNLKSSCLTLGETLQDIISNLSEYNRTQKHADKETPPSPQAKAKKEPSPSPQAKAKKELPPSSQAKAKKEIPPSSQAKAKKVPSPSPQAKAKKEPLLSSQGEAKKKTAKPNMNTATLTQKYNYFASVNVDIDSD